MLEDTQFFEVVDVGTEDFQRKVGGHVPIGADQPDRREASVAKLVQDFVTLVASANNIADVDGMVTTRDVLLNVLNVIQIRLAIPKRGQYLYLYPRHDEGME